MSKEAKFWLKLDNAAKIYPAARRRNWIAMFRFTAQLTEPVDPDLLQQAVAIAMPRFPGLAVRLKRGLFWFYLEHNNAVPDVKPDVNNPCIPIAPKENKHFLFRIRYYGSRIAVEVYHVACDGTGGLCFLKTVVAEYLTLKYHIIIPRGNGILDCSEAPHPEELEDAFQRYAGSETLSRNEDNAFHITGTDELPETIHITTGMIPVAVVLAKAKEKGVTLTEYLTSVLLLSIDTLQRREVKLPRHMKPVKVSVPVNLRSYFPSETIRNFSSYINPGINSRLGVYTLDEILLEVHSFMKLEGTHKKLAARFAANVRSEKLTSLRIAPLFLKNVVMRLAYIRWGDRKTSTTLTNLGRVKLPAEMEEYVTRMEVLLGPLSSNRVVCAAMSYGDTLYLNFTRTIVESRLEREFFKNLVRQGIPVKIESNNCY